MEEETGASRGFGDPLKVARCADRRKPRTSGLWEGPKLSLQTEMGESLHACTGQTPAGHEGEVGPQTPNLNSF